MNIYSLSSLIATISCFLLGVFVYFKDSSNPLSRAFTLITFLAGAWTLFPFLISLPEGDVDALLFARGVYVFAAFVPSAFYYLIFVLLDLKREEKEKLILKILVVASVFFSAVSFNSNFIEGTIRFRPFFAVVPGPLYFPFMLFMSLGSGYAFYRCIKGYLQSSASRRNQLKYFLISFGIAHTAAGLHFLSAYFQIEPIPHDILLILFPTIIAYAIVRHRLMDITVVFHKGLAYGILLGLVFVPTYMAILITQRATLFSIPPLLAATLILSCGLWVLFTNPRASPNVTFSLVCFGVFVWLFSCFMAYSTDNIEEATFWLKSAYGTVVYIPAFFYHFSTTFLQHRKGKEVIGAYISGTLFLLLIPGDFLIEGAYDYFWGYYAKAGDLHPLFLVYFGSVSGFSLLRLYKGYKSKEKVALLESTRIKYIFWAFIIAYLASIDFIQNYGIEIYPTGYVFVTLWVLIVTYAIARYQLMDITLIFNREKLLAYSQVLAIIPLYFVVLFLIRAFPGDMQYVLAGTLVAAFIIFAELLSNMREQMELAVGKVLFRKRYDAYKTLAQFSKAMVSVLDLTELSTKFRNTMIHVMGIQTGSLFYKDDTNKFLPLLVWGGDEETIRKMKLSEEEPLLSRLDEPGGVLIQEELERQPSTEYLHDVSDQLKALESEVCFPLTSHGRLVGFFNLGNKKNRAMYSNEDLTLLGTLAQSLAIALDNGLLYEDLKRQKNLMRRTDRLRSLETIAGGFAHEIRNPLTSIKTFVQLAPLRREDEEFVNSFSKVVSEDVSRIERLIQEILDYSRYMQPKLGEEDLTDVVDSSLYFVGVKAEGRGITIEKDYVEGLPRVLIDRQQIKQVLLNLFLNALDSMGDGGHLVVRTHRVTRGDDREWVQIEVGDSGGGITEENLEHIFDPFFTTKHESKEREGTGLGLSIVHQIVQEHRGFIEVKSQVGEGTTFYITLPANPLIHERRKEPLEVR